MTTSISKSGSELAGSAAESRTETAGQTVATLRHTLPSRFAFLIICLGIILSTLAYGTVHYWSLTLFFLGGVSLLVLWVLDCWGLGLVRISRNPLQLSILGMILLGLIQLLPLRGPANVAVGSIPLMRSLSFDPYTTRLVITQIVALLIFFAATLIFVDTPRRLKLLVRTITIFGFFLAIFGLTQQFTSPSKIYWIREPPQAQPFGPFINRHHFAGYMELAIALPLGLLFSGSLEKEKRFVYIFAVVLMGIALMLTNSRGGMIALVAEVTFLVALTGFRFRHKREPSDNRSAIRVAATKAGLALALIVALFAGVVLFGGEDVLQRLAGTVSTDDPTSGRAHFWGVAVDIIKNHPIIGIGLGAFAMVYTGYDTNNGLFRLEHVHNDYLQILTDGGILGAILGLFFVVTLFRAGFARRASDDPFRRGVANGALAGCFAVLVHSFFDFTLHTTANSLLFLVLAALATMNGRVEEAGSQHRRRRRRSKPMDPAIEPGVAIS
ncbi:MAG TPA: O-antigen ligase family protein [Pyrinomonadaceae bacterium]|nr:O-antigen ligase family protein [Pyrinomonadaceae bacterium]